MSDGTTGQDASGAEQGLPAAAQPTQAQSITPDPEGNVARAPATPGPIRKILTVIGDVLKSVIPGGRDLVEKYGLGVFAGFLLGLIVGGIILREWEWGRKIVLPAPEVERPVTPVAGEKREKLDSIKFSLAESQPRFLLDYENLFGRFGEGQRAEGTTENPPLGVVDYVFTKSVQAFTFKLRPRFGNSEINARVFHQLTTGDAKNPRIIYEPIFPEHGSSTEGFTYKVGECNANDKLLMILLVSPPQPGVTKFTDYFDVSLIE